MNKAQIVIVFGLLGLAAVIAIGMQTDPHAIAWFFRKTVVRLALGGAGVALRVDRDAFMAMKSMDDVLTYRWSTALLHAAQGALNGIGFDALIVAVTS